MLVEGYGSDDSETDAPATTTAPAPVVVSAPAVSVDVSFHSCTAYSKDANRAQMIVASTAHNQLAYNVEYDDLNKPEYGPATPYGAKSSLPRKNVPTGWSYFVGM